MATREGASLVLDWIAFGLQSFGAAMRPETVEALRALEAKLSDVPCKSQGDATTASTGEEGELEFYAIMKRDPIADTWKRHHVLQIGVGIQATVERIATQAQAILGSPQISYDAMDRVDRVLENASRALRIDETSDQGGEEK